MEKEVKIVPPEGFEIDEKNSTFECIKFKPIKKVWDWINKRISGFFISYCGTISEWVDQYNDTHCNLFATEKLAKSALAMAEISQILKNDDRYGGPITDEEWEDSSIRKCVIFRNGNNIYYAIYIAYYHFLAFHTWEQRELFFKEHEDLVKQYLMID